MTQETPQTLENKLQIPCAKATYFHEQKVNNSTMKMNNYIMLQANNDENQELNLQKFAYTPRASIGSSMTPSSVKATPKIPATPSGRGWEHLDLYHQQRHQQYQEAETVQTNGRRQ